MQMFLSRTFACFCNCCNSVITSHKYLKTNTQDFEKFFHNATQSFPSRSSFSFLQLRKFLLVKLIRNHLNQPLCFLVPVPECYLARLPDNSNTLNSVVRNLRNGFVAVFCHPFFHLFPPLFSFFQSVFCKIIFFKI